MARFLLWNVRGNQALDALVQNLVRQCSIDIVLLVEYDFTTSQLSNLLPLDNLYRKKSSVGFGVFVRQGHGLRRLNRNKTFHQRADVWRWMPPSKTRGIIALLHGYDRRNYDDGTRRMFFRQVVEFVRNHERAKGHTRSIVAGDFNANPFDPSIVDSDGAHAIGIRSVTTRSQTLHDRKVTASSPRQDFFYNPMWRLYGQDAQREAGAATHHWNRGWVHHLAWHMVDQVLVRPTQLSCFPENLLSIVTKIGSISLLNPNGIPDNHYSDHLPIVFEWNL